MKTLSWIDLAVIIPTVGLTAFSLAILSSTTPSLFFQQFIFIILGFGLYLFFSAIDFRIWSKFRWIFYIVGVILLLITFLGEEVRGSTRWIDLGWFRLQPSELMKPFYIIFLADFLSHLNKNTLIYIGKPFVLFLPILFLIFKQPDLGNVIIYLFLFSIMVTLSDLSFKSIILGGGFLGFLLPLSWIFLKDYQKARILSFLDPYADPKGVGYNALQAIIAIGSGRLTGLGLGHGTQSHLLFLPEYHTDFVFAAIAEELGFLGAFLVLLFYFILLLRILTIALKIENKFARFLSVGIFAQLFVQVLINIGMNLGLLPITGITLPFLSYGGSSLISTFIGLGIVSNISQKERTQSPIEIK